MGGLPGEQPLPEFEVGGESIEHRQRPRRADFSIWLIHLHRKVQGGTILVQGRRSVGYRRLFLDNLDREDHPLLLADRD